MMKEKAIGNTLLWILLFIIQPAISQPEYRGGAGRGDQAITTGIIVITGASAPNLYAGGSGRGDAVVMQPLIVIDGNMAPNIYMGGAGRGDFSTKLPLLVITGNTIPDMYRGGSGRGDFATAKLRASLVDCNQFIVWTGEKDANWHNEGNWSCEVVPGPQHKVYIPEGRQNYPIISGNVTILRLEVQPAAKVSLQQNARLTITGTGQ